MLDNTNLEYTFLYFQRSVEAAPSFFSKRSITYQLEIEHEVMQYMFKLL